MFPFSLLIKPFVCPGCQEPSVKAVCADCMDSFRKIHSPILQKNEGILGVFPVFYSLQTTHQILVHWKKHGGQGLQRLLFDASPSLIQEIRELDIQEFIPIPQHEDRNLKRGHAPALEVARWFSGLLNQELTEDALLLNPEPGDKQAMRSQWDRRYLGRPFQANPKYRGKLGTRILLIDDFITSGSTMEKAANALLELVPDAKIYAACLGWKPRVVPRLREPYRWMGFDRKHQTASPEYQIDSQFVPMPPSTRTNR